MNSYTESFCNQATWCISGASSSNMNTCSLWIDILSFLVELLLGVPPETESLLISRFSESVSTQTRVLQHNLCKIVGICLSSSVTCWHPHYFLLFASFIGRSTIYIFLHVPSTLSLILLFSYMFKSMLPLLLIFHHHMLPSLCHFFGVRLHGRSIFIRFLFLHTYYHPIPICSAYWHSDFHTFILFPSM